MSKKAITDEMRERVENADRCRRWREAREHLPDTRRIDRVLAEALVEHLRQTPGSNDLLQGIIADATAGLEFQGYPVDEARREVAKRLRYLTTGAGVSTGSVRTALDRKRREAEWSATKPR